MVALMDPSGSATSPGSRAMGNEGAQWIGMAPFVDRQHIVQNLGDGTYFHSGSLAVRAAVAAGVNITFKLLYNGTVAMTGGQDPQGQMDVPERRQMAAPRRRQRVIVTTDDLDRYDSADFGPTPSGSPCGTAPGSIEAQEVLAAVAGVTVLVHDQACAAEKRRARSRGKLAKPTSAVVINERVCEGCGDCGDKSNCLSVQPVDDAVRAQDPHPPDELQLRHDVPRGRLPVVRPRHGRPRPAAGDVRRPPVDDRRPGRRPADPVPPCRPTSSSSACPASAAPA